MSLSLAAQEAVWRRQLLVDVGYDLCFVPIIFEDNQGAMELTKNAKFHNRTKHVDIAYYFLRERISSKEKLVNYCPTENMLADGLTKGLGRMKFEHVRYILNTYPAE